MQTIKTFSIHVFGRHPTLKLSLHVGKEFRTVKFNKHRSQTHTPFFSSLVDRLLLLASVSRVRNQKRLSQGENCKHVNKSINSIFYGRFDVLRRFISVCLRKSDLISQKSMKTRTNAKINQQWSPTNFLLAHISRMLLRIVFIDFRPKSTLIHSFWYNKNTLKRVYKHSVWLRCANLVLFSLLSIKSYTI